MKKIGILQVALIAAMSMNAQVPSAFNFQAVLRNADGEVLKNAEIALYINLLEDNKTTVYPRISISTTSDSLGMIQVSIPQKESLKNDPISNLMSNLAGTLWMEIKAWYSVYIDENGDGEKEHHDEGIINFPSQQLLSVPYAMVSGNVMLSSPNGNNYSLSVDDDGNLSTSLVDGVDTTRNQVPSRNYIVMDNFGFNAVNCVIRTQDEYEDLLGRVPTSKVDFTTYTLVLYSANDFPLKEYYLEKVSDIEYVFRKVPDLNGVLLENKLYGLLIPKIDKSVSVNFTPDKDLK